MDEYYNEYPSNAHRGDYKTSVKSSEQFEKARDTVKEFINARYREEIVFTDVGSILETAIQAVARVFLTASLVFSMN